MKIKDLKEYINTFEESEEMSIVVLDTEKRIVHKNKMAQFLSDAPALILEVEGIEPMDEVLERVSEDG
jgi:hypothetical protein